MKVVFFDVESYELDFLTKNCESKYQYLVEQNSLNNITQIKKEYLDADVISVFTSSRVTEDVLKQFKNLKLIVLRSVGFNHIDIDYCKKHSIRVENSPNYGNITVSEFALALLLNVTRKVTFSYNEFKNGDVTQECLIGSELSGKNIGIVGLGAIGSAFAKISHALDMNILAYDIKENKDLERKYNVKYVNFDELLTKSDFISIHAPLTKENYHMFNSDAFKKMKKSAIIINTGRGELIDSKALYNAISTKQILGAGLDVLEKEETMTDFDYIHGINRLDKFTLEQTVINSQLFKCDNVILTPHIAFNSKEAINRILATTIHNIDEFLIGNLGNIVV